MIIKVIQFLQKNKVKKIVIINQIKQENKIQKNKKINNK